MDLTTVKSIYRNTAAYANKEVTLGGWIRTMRVSKNFGFIELNDGSFFKNIQIVFEAERLKNYEEISKQNVGAALIIKGLLVETPEAKQPFEVKATQIDVEGTSTPDYPLQKKRHSLEYLRTIAHLRPRTRARALYKPIHPSSQAPTVRVQAKCSVSLHWIWITCLVQPMAR